MRLTVLTVPYELRIRPRAAAFDASTCRGFALVFLDADSNSHLAVLPTRIEDWSLRSFLLDSLAAHCWH